MHFRIKIGNLIHDFVIHLDKDSFQSNVSLKSNNLKIDRDCQTTGLHNIQKTDDFTPTRSLICFIILVFASKLGLRIRINTI